MARIIIGTSALEEADPEPMREAGIEWVRQGFPLPFEDRIGGKTTEAYEQAKARTRDWARKGFGIMGVTPLPGICRMEPDEQGKLEIVWTSRMPDWMGPVGSEQYMANYQAVCHWLAEDLAELVSLWQIANELDIVEFAGSCIYQQALRRKRRPFYNEFQSGSPEGNTPDNIYRAVFHELQFKPAALNWFAFSAGKAWSWFESLLHEEDLGHIFCSELCAAAHREIGMLRTDNVSRWNPNRFVRYERWERILAKPWRLK